MKSKPETKLIVSFLSILLFSTTAYTQSKNIMGQWRLLSFIENGNNISLIIHRPKEKEISPQLWLMKDSFSLTPACNHTDGKYTITKSGRLKFTPLRTTVMHCGDEALEMDRRLVAALSKAVKYKIKNKVLTLQDASGQNILTFNRSSLRNQSPEQEDDLPPIK